ncbi:hypothetical protein AB0I57_09675, partial [Rhodococcus sp. NPDC049939]
TQTNTVINTMTVGNDPRAVTITPNGKRAYVTNFSADTVSVIAIDQCIGSLCIDFGALTDPVWNAASVFS